MTLYLKYRPKNLSELDLTDVGESLKNITAGKETPHAFLFAGPKGTGKTSAARILAKIFNCEDLGKNGTPCDKCNQCKSITKGNNLDVIEMDAASHRGIDDVRTLRDAVKLAPVAGKKKIYIIDEAHMLTTEASNALLKTLEEPPAHVIFILATTNPEKLIDTIKSRVTYVPFRKATTPEIVRSLKRVIEGEKLKIKEDALILIAEAADGAFRDAIKILEQLVSEEKELTKEFLEEYLFSKKSFDLDNFTELLIKKDTKALIEGVESLGKNGVAVETFLEALMKKLRSALLTKIGIEGEDIKDLSKQDLIYLIELMGVASRNLTDAVIEELPLEVAVIEWCEEEGDRPQSAHSEQNSPVVKSDTGSVSSHSQAAESAGTLDSASQSLAQTIVPDIREQAASPVGEGEMNVNDDAWKTILSLIKPVNASIEALLRAARPVNYDGRTLTLGVYYKFHKERLEDNQHRLVLENIVGEVLKSPTRITCILVEPPIKKVEEAKVEPVLTEGKDRDILKVAEEIFSN